MPAILAERTRTEQPAPQLTRVRQPEIPIVVMRGDGAANGLLDESLRVLAATGVPLRYEEFDLGLASRTATEFGVVRDAAKALRQYRGIKAATMRPPKAVSVDRTLRTETDASVIVRTAEPVPGTPAAENRGPITIVRMAYAETEGEVLQDPEGQDIGYETRWVPRTSATNVARYTFKLASESGGVVIGGPERAKDTLDGMLWQELFYAQGAFPDVEHEGMTLPRLLGRLYTPDPRHLFVPAHGRDGNIVSEFAATVEGGNAAMIPSTTLTLGGDMDPFIVWTDCVDDEPARREPDRHYNPTGMILAGAELLGHMSDKQAQRASLAVKLAVNETLNSGTKTPDLGGNATTNDFTDEVIGRVQDKLKPAR